MNQFLSNHRLALTPLTPIHIGCGEDFEPTNYIIEKGVLYGFDPSRAVLTDIQRKRLMEAGRRASLLEIQQFFRQHAELFKPFAQVVIPVCAGAARQYEQRIGRPANVETDGARVFNRLEIERHVYTGRQQWTFVPGSSFKGALRTAWLDVLNDGKRSQRGDDTRESSVRLERRLLWGPDQQKQQGDFDSSPLRLVKIADFMPVREPEREVLFAVNRKKKQILRAGQEIQPKGISGRKDCMLHGQYRLLSAELTLPVLGKHAGAVNNKRQPIAPRREQLNGNGGIELHELAARCNRYHLPRLRSELQLLEQRRFIDSRWKQAIEQLLAPSSALSQKLREGNAFLIRLGRYGGAESKTLSGEGVASIKIMGARGERPTFESITKTVWLAAQNEDDQTQLLPFGWSIVEIDPRSDCSELQSWCLQQTRERPNISGERARLKQLRAEAENLRIAQAEEVAARARERAAEEIRTEQLAQARAKMSPQEQQIEKLRQACEDFSSQLKAHPNYRKQAANSNVTGLYQDAWRLVETALTDDDWSSSDKSNLADMLEISLPGVIAGWNAKEQRKKLRLNQLRGR